MEHLTIDKIIIPTSECVPGMIIRQSIVEENSGAIIVPNGQILTEESIEKLKKFKHTGVWISIESEQALWKMDDETRETYEGYAFCLKEIIEGVKEEAELVGRLEELTKNIILECLDEYQMLSCINLSYQLPKDIYHHSLNVAFLSLLIGRWADYKEEKLKKLVLAALLHDVGRLSVETSINLKEEKEMDVMEKFEFRKHPVYAYEKLKDNEEVDLDILKGVLSHHERCDGSGYPLSLRESKIGDFAKVIAIADTYDYLKQKTNIFAVIQDLGSAMLRKFDVNLLLQFCINIANYYVGASVLLNTGEVGKVVFIQSQALGRPIVKVNGEYINLYEKVQLDITHVF